MKVHSTSFSSDKPGLHCILNVIQKSFFDSAINVYIPKCQVSGEIKLKNIMYSLGVADIFTDKADLSGVTGQPQHRLSEVRYKFSPFL